MGRPKGSVNRKAPTIRARFEQHVQPEPNTGCWLWAGALTSGGYGNFWVAGAWKPAHRFIYEMERGVVAPDMELDHLCRMRCCVNPDHLEPVTSGENSRRSSIMGRPRSEQCPRGHSYEGSNLGLRPNGRRYCRSCARQARLQRSHADA